MIENQQDKCDSKLDREFYDDIYYGTENQAIEFRWFSHYHKRFGLGYYLDMLYLMGEDKSLDKRKKILDVACGIGTLLKRSQELGLKAYGVDFSLNALNKSKHKGREIPVVLADVSQGIPFVSECFDYITCLGSIEHFRNQEPVIAEMARVSKKGATLCFHVPNANFFLTLLGLYTEGQPIQKSMSYANYLILFDKYGLRVSKVMKDNGYFFNLRFSSSLKRFFLKLLIRPFLAFIPFRYSEGYIFVLSKSKKAT